MMPYDVLISYDRPYFEYHVLLGLLVVACMSHTQLTNSYVSQSSLHSIDGKKLIVIFFTTAFSMKLRFQFLDQMHFNGFNPTSIIKNLNLDILIANNLQGMHDITSSYPLANVMKEKGTL